MRQFLSETHKESTKRNGHCILERYRMTETNMITSNPNHEERGPGTVGKPLSDVHMKIIDPETGKRKPKVRLA